MSAPVCVDPNHFQINDAGAIAPQPWMQYRQVASNSADSQSGSYAPTVTVGLDGTKNDLLQDVTAAWTNDTPIDQWVYGLITRGGARVTLQARSRGGLTVVSGYQEGTPDEGDTVVPITACSVLGCGADMGRGGILAAGTAYCIMEVRQSSTTFPLAPERAGWHRLAPGATFTGQVQVYFTSDQWESSDIEGGNLDTESSYLTGPTRIDLFAIPVL